jgi:glycerol kinase
MAQFILALDQGTTYSRAFIFNEKGREKILQKLKDRNYILLTI